MFECFTSQNQKAHNMKRFLLFLVASLLAVACDNKFEDEANSRQGKVDMPKLTAGFAEDTRTYVEDGFYLRWHEGDLISAFVGNTRNTQYIFEGETGDKGGYFMATESGLGASKLDRIYALYPYDKSAEISTNGVISCSISTVQKYAENSFGKGANTMVAVTKDLDDTFLSFKNTCGYLKIKLYGNGTVKSIELKGNNGEKIAGAATTTMAYGDVPQLTMATDATKSITLNCGEGVALSNNTNNPTEFWVVVPPMEFSEGVTITATDVNGSAFEKNTSKKVVIDRNKIQPMSAIEVLFEEIAKPAYNEIWYTSSDGEIVESYNNVFGANIVSNTYKAGQGIITFDGDVTTIGYLAFAWCRSLTSVTIPDSVTTIGEDAFWCCGSLTSVTIGGSVTTIGKSAFYNCTSLTSVTIPNSVTTIGESAFRNCDSLTSVTIGDSVTTIGYSAFFGCESLTSITIPDSVTTIGDDAFRYCNSLTSVTIPDSVTTIGDDAFRYCDSLTSVTIGDSVTTIGEGAFASCSSLKEFNGKFASDGGRCLIIDGVLNSFAPAGLSEYTIPDSVTTIGNSAFAWCDSLTSVTIGDSVTSIGDYVFWDCSNLKYIYSKPTTPPSLENSVFHSTNIQAIYVPTGSVEAYKAKTNWKNYADKIEGYDF